MVLDVLKEKFGSRNCIHVEGRFKFRKRFRPGMSEEDLDVDAERDSAPAEPVYDPAIHELAHDDAEFGPGVSEITHEDTETEMNKAFVNVIR